ncbi:MAG: hypothetical protein K2N30_04100 [Clostridia bacterium]|nr:hypothetical protein [Clostridia bacterium]
MEERLKSVYARLDNMTIYEVRQIAREVRAQVVSGKKGDIIDAIMSYARGEAEAKPLTARGAPPKSDKYDEKLVEDIRALRRDALADKDGERNVIKVSDGLGGVHDRTVCGYVECADGDYRLVADGSSAILPLSYVTRFAVREGDKIEGTARRVKDEDAVVSIESINGKTSSEIKGRKNFSSLSREYPSRRVILSKGNDAAVCRFCDLFAPVALGQRAYICSPVNGGKTTALKQIALGISSGYPQFKVILLVTGGKPEELSDFNRSFPSAEKFFTDFGASAVKNLRTARLAFEYAKRQVELGGNVILLADGLLEACGQEEGKSLLCNACNAEEEGSLTVIATLTTPDCGAALSTANAVLNLSPDLASARIYPAADAKKSYSSREEALLSADELSAANNLRRKCSAEEIIDIVKYCGVAQITEKYKNG